MGKNYSDVVVAYSLCACSAIEGGVLFVPPRIKEEAKKCIEEIERISPERVLSVEKRLVYIYDMMLSIMQQEIFEWISKQSRKVISSIIYFLGDKDAIEFSPDVVIRINPDSPGCIFRLSAIEGEIIGPSEVVLLHELFVKYDRNTAIEMFQNEVLGYRPGKYGK